MIITYEGMYTSIFECVCHVCLSICVYLERACTLFNKMLQLCSGIVCTISVLSVYIDGLAIYYVHSCMYVCVECKFIIYVMETYSIHGT